MQENSFGAHVQQVLSPRPSVLRQGRVIVSLATRHGGDRLREARYLHLRQVSVAADVTAEGADCRHVTLRAGPLLLIASYVGVLFDLGGLRFPERALPVLADLAGEVGHEGGGVQDDDEAQDEGEEGHAHDSHARG